MNQKVLAAIIIGVFLSPLSRAVNENGSQNIPAEWTDPQKETGAL
jgi:hypothetical protein